MLKKKINTQRLYAPITRTEEFPDYTLVEGFAYVNPEVKSDRYNLTRAAMEAASAEYMKFPAVREMHGSNAAGTGMSLEWTDQGVKLTSHVVDPVARLKVQQGVYRGYSVGVSPKVVRGNEVITCEWIETSLVDRPADPDAVFTMVRTEELPAEVEVEVQRSSFADYMAAYSGSQMRQLALDWLWEALWDIQNGEAENKAELVRETCDQFREFMVNVVEGGLLELAEERTENPDLLRLFTELPAVERQALVEQAGLPERVILTTEAHRSLTESISALTTERDKKSGELARVEGEFASTKAELERLKEEPRSRKAVRVPEALQRTFAAQGEDTKKKQTLQEEYDQLVERLKDEPNARMRSEGAVQMQRLKQEIAAL